MERESGNFSQIQLSRRSRSKSSIWRAKDVESSTIDSVSRRQSTASSIMSVADQWAQSRPRDPQDSRPNSIDRGSSISSSTQKDQGNRRWDGTKRSTAPWDEIRRDPELWFPDGDVFIHFHGRGASRKGPSLRLHRDDLETAGCMHMLSKFADNALLEEDEDEYDGNEEHDGQDGGFKSNPNTRGKEELFIPSPPLLNRDEAQKFHIATRNFFAVVYEKPVVGAHLGEALVLVHERFNLYRPDKERNRDDMLAYCDEQRYTDFRDCPDHAMAMMYYAEKLRETDLWTEAFVHAVGMYDILNTSIEFPTVSRTIGALITRAHLEMTLRLEHAYADLGGFMEDSITSAFPKLSDAALAHLERFRGFLQSYYVQQHGYWPPPSLQPGADYSIVTKSLLKGMYDDLRNLYQFLRDAKSTARPTQAQIETYNAIYGGITTPQLIGAFDRRFKHTPLPNPLPLLPSGVSGEKGLQGDSLLNGLDIAGTAKPTSGGSFARFLRPSKKKSTKALNTLSMLSAATNTNEPEVMESLLVQEYARFERDWTMRGEEKIDPVEGRKVRWLLVYALLQTVIGVIVIPQEVSSTEKVEYPLCVQTGGTPPWRKRMKTKAVMDGRSTPFLEAHSGASSPAASPYMTPNSARSTEAIMPALVGEDVPPVPQLVLSELQKLDKLTHRSSQGSFDSTKQDSRSPRPAGTSADSLRSNGTARPPKSNLKSSASSIRSNASGRSSFSAMLNRSLYISSTMGSELDASNKTPRQTSNLNPDRPPLPKAKTAPAAAHSGRPSSGSIKGGKKDRSSLFNWSRTASRQGSRSGSPQPESMPTRFAAASPVPTSPSQSTLSNLQDMNSESTHRDSETLATSEFPQSATSERSQGVPALKSPEPPRRGPKYVPAASQPIKVNGHPPVLAPVITEPEAERGRGRTQHSPYSPTAASDSQAKKVPNFSRGRSMERLPSSAMVNPEAPPPIPSATKPMSRSATPEPKTQEVYTSSEQPPRVPVQTQPQSYNGVGYVSQPLEPVQPHAYTTSARAPQLPEIPHVHSKTPSPPRNTVPPTAIVKSTLVEHDEFYDAPSPDSPPPVRLHSKPNSRSNSVSGMAPNLTEIVPPLPSHSKPVSRVQSPAPPMEHEEFTNAMSPWPILAHTNPDSRPQSPAPMAQVYTDSSSPPAVHLGNKPPSRPASRSPLSRVPDNQFTPEQPPPVPTASKPPTRRSSPVRQAIASPTSFKSAVSSPVAETPIAPVPVQTSRSAQPAVQVRSKAQAYQNVRPVSDISEGTASAGTNTQSRSPSPSPVSEFGQFSSDTSTELLQRMVPAISSQPATSISAPVHSADRRPSPQPRPSAAARADRQYQRVPASREQATFAEEPRAVIVDKPEVEDSVGQAVTAPGNATFNTWQGQDESPARSLPPVPQQQQQQQQQQPRSRALSQTQPSLRQPRPPAPLSSVGAPRPIPQSAQSQSYKTALLEAEERRSRTPTSNGAAGAGRTLSRESKFRRVAWAELGGGAGRLDAGVAGPRSSSLANPPAQVKKYGAPILRDRYEGGGGRDELTDSDDEDGGVEGGLGSYGVKRGIMG